MVGRILHCIPGEPVRRIGMPSYQIHAESSQMDTYGVYVSLSRHGGLTSSRRVCRVIVRTGSDRSDS
ncbi:hypothetical protein [Duncaniella muris]|uniref:hypothetical protein n=1 Tax=Duncaniella muris TaxID=2094150 RepID=UPI003F67FC54